MMHDRIATRRNSLPGRRATLPAILAASASCALLAVICVVGLAGGNPEPVLIHLGSGKFENAAFSPDGESLTVTSEEGLVKVYSTDTWELMWERSVFDGRLTGVAFSPDGEALVVSGLVELEVIFLDPGTGDETRRLTLTEEIHGYPEGVFYGVLDVEFSPDGKLLVCTNPASDMGTAKLADVQTGRELGTPILHVRSNGLWETKAAFSPDGSHLASTSPKGTLLVIDVLSGEVLLDSPSAGSALDFAFTPDGDLFTVYAYRIQRWDSHDWTRTNFGTKDPGATMNYLGWPNMAVAVSPDGSLVASSSCTLLRLWGVETEDLLWSYDIPPRGFAWTEFSPDGSLLALGPAMEAYVEVWRVADLMGD